MTNTSKKMKGLGLDTIGTIGKTSAKSTSKLMSPTVAQLTLDMMSDAVISSDTNGIIKYLNQAAVRLTGWHAAEAIGRRLHEVVHTEQSCLEHDLMMASSLVNDEYSAQASMVEMVLVRKDGGKRVIEKHQLPLLNGARKTIGSIIILRDVTEVRAEMAKMRHLAQHDSLTGLANRNLMQERLNQSLLLAKRHGKLLAILYLDIDLFKNINDAHGHLVGDKLLCSVAQRMCKSVRTTDTVCRQGGDEFVILLSEIEQASDALLFSQKLKASLAAAHIIDDRKIFVNVSIGISIFPNDGEEDAVLLQRADASMFKQKFDGPSRSKNIRREH